MEKENILKNTKEENSILLKDGNTIWQPEKLEIADEKKKPNFEKSEEVTLNNLVLYGKALARIIPSHDGTLRYMFIEHEEGVFLATVEKVGSEITKYGNRKTFLGIGDLKMPLLEHAVQIPMGYTSHKGKEKYMYATNYLAKIPLIQEYQKHFLSTAA